VRRSDPGGAEDEMARRKSALSKSAGESADQRAAQRFTLILRAGKLLTPSGEYLCVLRDVSSGGLRLRLFHPLALPPSVKIELTGGEQYQLDLAWQDGEQAGFRFADGPVDPGRLLEEAGPFPKRSIRLRLHQPLEIALRGDGPAVQAQLHDISQFGAALSCDERLAIGQHFELDAPGLGQLAARVRWRRGGLYGLVFEQSYRLDGLARLAARLQRAENGSAKAINLARVNH
jgi:hypothetical protein